MGNQPSTPQPGAQFQVIGAGLPRTGTTSFTEALRILLSGPVYHGGTQVTVGPESDVKSWIKILSLHPTRDRAAVLDGLRETFDGYVACTDSPSCGFFPELLEIYPDAKVIVTVRDPAGWEKSMDAAASASAIWFMRILVLPLPTVRYFFSYVGGLREQYIRLYGQKEPLTQEVYHKHIAWLKRTVPEDRLVFFDVKDGWGPLCEALGREVPDVPFPRLNDSESIERLSKEIAIKGLQRWAGILGGLASVLGSTWWFWGKT